MYYGAVVGHKRSAVCVGGKHTAAVPKEEQFIVEGAHEGIVTKEEFLKVQEIFCKTGGRKQGPLGNYPLYRKVRCGTCGRAMIYKRYSFRGIEYRYFGCTYAKEQVGENGCCKRYIKETDLNAIVWSVVKQLLDMTEVVKQKVDEQKADSQKSNLFLAEKLAELQKKKEKCETDRFANMDMFMAGDLDKKIYQSRRVELARLSEEIDAEIEKTEVMLHEAETAANDEMEVVYDQMKKYSGENQLNQEMVEALIDKVVVTDPEHVEIVWKFSDEVYKFIME